MQTLTPEFANDVLDSLTAHIAVLDSSGVIIAVNKAWKRFAQENGGEDQTSYIGVNYLAICEDAVRRGAGETAEATLRGFRAVLHGEQDQFSLEYDCHSRSEERWFIVRITSCRRERTAILVVAHENITARKQAERALLHTKEAFEAANRELQQALAREQLTARTDDLTGVNNRRHFFNIAKREMGVAKRYRHPLSIILFDIDHFKRVNDTWGHQVGDEMLKRVAQIASAQLREVDVLARYGGEEFIVLLPDSNARQSAVVAERIREGIEASGMDTATGRVSVTVSTGVAEALPAEDSPDEFIRRADQALYKAKDSGRNCTVIFSPGV